MACAPSADEDIRNQLELWGVTYRHIPMARAGMSPSADLKTLLALVALFREERPDLVLAYTIKPVIWGCLGCRLVRGPKSYAMITGLGYAFITSVTFRHRIVQRIVRVLYRLALRNVSAVFFQNPDDEREFRRRKLIRDVTPSILVNGSGVDLQHFQVLPLPDKPIFLLLARLVGDKGIREYHEAACILRRKYPAARFLLAGGEDPNPNAIRDEEIRGWREEGVVEFLGKLDDVRPAFAESTIYVLPSYREGTPRTVLEAMATGRAIITTDAPGCRETVDDGVNGYLVPPKDSQGLAEAMERFIKSSELRRQMGSASRRKAEEKYDVDKVNHVILKGLGIQ